MAKQRPNPIRPVRPRGDRRGQGRLELALRAKAVGEALRSSPVVPGREHDRAITYNVRAVARAVPTKAGRGLGEYSAVIALGAYKTIAS